MALLNDTDKEKARSGFAIDISKAREPIAVTKPELTAAVNALDLYLNNNAGMINAALPLAARTGMTTQQKARLLMHVIKQRYISGA